jgi:hypothetical protein
MPSLIDTGPRQTFAVSSLVAIPLTNPFQPSEGRRQIGRPSMKKRLYRFVLAAIVLLNLVQQPIQKLPDTVRAIKAVIKKLRR